MRAVVSVALYFPITLACKMSKKAQRQSRVHTAYSFRVFMSSSLNKAVLEGFQTQSGTSKGLP